MILSKANSIAGTTLVESAIAACTAALFLGSVFAMNMTAMKTMKTAREASSASQVLQQGVESLRIANWHQITDANWLQADSRSPLSGNIAGSDSLKQVTETLTLEPFEGTTTGITQIVRSGGTTQIVSRNDSLLTERAVKVILTVAYNGGVNSQPTTRQTVAVVAQGGVAKW
ncbi:MAG: hypothetical protein ACJ8HQ_05450 [Chthoniobacterales bacterium]